MDQRGGIVQAFKIRTYSCGACQVRGKLAVPNQVRKLTRVTQPARVDSLDCGLNSLLQRRELPDRARLHCIARLEDCTRERGLIRRVGEMLGFQAQSRPFAVHLATLALDGSIQEIAGIELHAGLRRRHLQDASAYRLGHFGGE